MEVAARADDEVVNTLQAYLRPEVDGLTSEAATPLIEQVEDVRQRVEQFTEDQMRMADVAEANPRVFCAGGAGTGKTFLAERLARRWAARRREGRCGVSVSLAAALPRVAALGAGAHRVADRRSTPRLPPRGTHALRRAHRGRRAGPVRDALPRNAGRRPCRWAGIGALVLVP